MDLQTFYDLYNHYCIGNVSICNLEERIRRSLMSHLSIMDLHWRSLHKIFRSYKIVVPEDTFVDVYYHGWDYSADTIKVRDVFKKLLLGETKKFDVKSLL